MVKRIIEEDKDLCQCEECGMQYENKELAENGLPKAKYNQLRYKGIFPGIFSR